MPDERGFPPMDPVPAKPDRYSQTLLRNADRCPRSAALGVKYRNAPASHPMMRGTLVHEFAAELMRDLMLRGERSLLDGLGDDPGQVAAVTAAMIEGIADRHPELALRAADMEAARVCAYHIAIGLDVDPQTVVAVERKFVLEIAGATVSGIIDLAAFPDAFTGAVDDYKTTLGVLTSDVYAESFQTKLYALLLVKGRPVLEEIVCHACDGKGVWAADPGERCPECKGKRKWETLGDPIGGHLTGVRTREIYPRVGLRPDGTMVSRENVLTRGELVEFEDDVARLVKRVDASFESGDFPAVSGSWCTECPCEPECPIPAHLRRFAGVIDSVEKASEALAWCERVSDRVSATRKEVTNFARSSEEPIPVGNKIFEFVTTESRSVRKAGKYADWPGLEFAVDQAVKFGAPFNLDEWLKTTTRTEFKGRRAEGVTDGDAGAAGSSGGRGLDGDPADRWGDDAPF